MKPMERDFIHGQLEDSRERRARQIKEHAMSDEDYVSEDRKSCLCCGREFMSKDIGSVSLQDIALVGQFAGLVRKGDVKDHDIQAWCDCAGPPFWPSLDAWQEHVWPKLRADYELKTEWWWFVGIKLDAHAEELDDADLSHASAAVRTVALATALRERGAT